MNNDQDDKYRPYQQYDQDSPAPRVRLAWGRRGAQDAAARGDILVVVDTLRFSTAAATAVHHGALIYPCATDAAIYNSLARRVDGEVALHHAATTLTRFSLSPRSFLDVEPGARIVLPSPNGSTCSQYGSYAHAVFVGALVNARAVAGAVSSLLDDAKHLNVTVLACGERWREPGEDGALRFAVEDYLGAGAILSALPFPQTMEAQVCAATFEAMRDRLDAALWECESGQELREKGLGEDVRFAARLNVYDTAPILRGERLEAFAADEGLTLA